MSPSDTWLVDNKRLEQAHSYLADRLPLQIETLQRWCQQNSGSEHLAGLRAMADLLEQDFAIVEAPCQRIALSPIDGIDDEGQVTQLETADLLCWNHCPEATRRVLLMIHYDTVYSPEESVPVRLDASGCSRLIGPGTADAKGGLLVMREALSTLRRFELDEGIGWSAWANPDEEIGSPATHPLIAQHARSFDFGLLFEPTLPDGALVAARKGSGNFTVVVHGRSAHAGRDLAAGRNALIHLARILLAIDGLNSQASSTTVNVARFRSGGPFNRVPDLAVGRFNVRAVDRESVEEILEKIQNLMNSFQSDGFRVEWSGAFSSPPKPVDANADALQRRVAQAASTVGRTIQWRDTGGACDGSKWAAAGLANIDTLGPTGDFLHSPKEWVDTQSIVTASQILVSLLAQYAAETRAGY